MKIEFQFDLEDFTAFQKYHLLNSKAYKVRSFIRTVVFPLLIAIYLMFQYSRGKINGIVIVIFLALVFTGLYFFQKISLNKYMKKIGIMIPHDRKQDILGKHIVDFRENVIKFNIPSTQYSITWESVEQIVITKDYYFLFKSAEMSIIIPKKKLDLDTLEMHQLDQLILSKKELLS